MTRPGTKIVAVWSVGADGVLYRSAYQVFCPGCGYLGSKVSYHAAEQQRKKGHGCSAVPA